jgi:hypothetical protein
MSKRRKSSAAYRDSLGDTQEHLQRKSFPSFFWLYLWLVSAALLILYTLYLWLADLLQKWFELPRSGTIYIILVFLGIISHHFSRRGLITTARDKIASDQRPPVLLLRSFTDDKRMSKKEIDEVDGEIDFVTEEERIVHAIESLGPVIGLGNPGDNLPPLGIARDYVQNNQWHQKVLKYISKSGYVFILTNTTHGLSWEIRNVIAHIDLSQVFVLVQRGKQKYRHFCELYKGIFPEPLPEYQRGILVRTGGITGIISFEKDWTTHFHRIGYNSLRSSTGNLVSDRIRCTIADILIPRGIQYTRPVIQRDNVYALIFLGFIIILGTFSVLWLLVIPYIRQIIDS